MSELFLRKTFGDSISTFLLNLMPPFFILVVVTFGFEEFESPSIFDR